MNSEKEKKKISKFEKSQIEGTEYDFEDSFNHKNVFMNMTDREEGEKKYQEHLDK